MHANFEDPSVPSYIRKNAPKPDLKPYYVTLKDGIQATLFPCVEPLTLPPDLIEFLFVEFNKEVEEGQTYPQLELLTFDEFKGYWLGAFTCVMLTGTDTEIKSGRNWEQEYLGTYYTKPNYVGRCSHICNAGFLVNKRFRGKGIGIELAKSYLKWAPMLGYTYSIFNLVFITNPASWKIWDSLGFERVGIVKKAGVLKGFDEPVDAIIFGKDLV